MSSGGNNREEDNVNNGSAAAADVVEPYAMILNLSHEGPAMIDGRVK